MKRIIEGADRAQATFLPECLDDWVDEYNPVRAIDAFVNALDLTEFGFEGVEPAATGRPAYHPSLLLKLYIYGYLNRVQSSRRLEREAGRNLEVIWHYQSAHGGDALPDEAIAEGRHRNGATRARLQSDARDEHPRCQTAHRRHEGVRGKSRFLSARNHFKNGRPGSEVDRRQAIRQKCSEDAFQKLRLHTPAHHVPTRSVLTQTRPIADMV